MDPLEIARRLFNDPNFDWDETPKMLESGVATIQLETFGVIGKAVRSAFIIPAVERGGLTDTECLEMLANFRDFMGDVKKNGSLFPILPESTDSASSAEIFPMKPGLGFGSTVTEPSSEPPTSHAAGMFGNSPNS
jgi:hypothetical protein